MTTLSRSKLFRTRMVALAAGTAMLFGSTMVTAPTATAKPPASPEGNDLQCVSPHGVHPLKNRGKQILTVDSEYGPGIATGDGVITVKGYGFTENQSESPNFKINDHSPEDKDHEPFWPPQPAAFGTTISNDGRSLNPSSADMPNAEGRFDIKFKLPVAGNADGQIGEGLNWIRILSANPYFSHYALFLVLPQAVAEKSKDARVTVKDSSTNATTTTVSVRGQGFTPKSQVKLELNCNAVTNAIADSDGKFSVNVNVATETLKDRVDRQVIAREIDSSNKLVRAAVGYNTETTGGSEEAFVVPENEKVTVKNGLNLTNQERDAVIALAKKYVPGGTSYSYNRAKKQVEVYTAGNNQTRTYDLSVFADVKSNIKPGPSDPAGLSPIAKVIIALVAILGLGGAAFAAWNWAISQGFIR